MHIYTYRGPLETVWKLFLNARAPNWIRLPTMSYLRGPDRAEVQLLPACLDDYVSTNAPVRFIEAYVEGLDLQALGLKRAQEPTLGRPPYHPADMIKLYVYGYLHRIRSSRRLEKESGRNLELMWLLRGIKPDFKTIADFRRDNRGVFKGLFKDFNLLCRQMGLFAAELVAVDGSKFKAVNNLRRYYTQEQLRDLVEKVEGRIEEYLSQLDHQDSEAEGAAAESNPQGLQEKIEQLRQRQSGYQQILEELKAAGENGRGINDPDSRTMVRGGGQRVVGYNVQVAVDAKHDLIVAEDVIQDRNDRGQLAALAVAAKAELGVKKLQVVADAGYHEADQLEVCEKENIETFVPGQGTTSGQGKDGQKIFPKEQFIYDPKTDSYQCPAQQILKRGTLSDNRIPYSNRAACRECALRSSCTSSAFRTISRLPNEAVVERAAERMAARPEVVVERQAIVEHVFGTLRVWGFDKFLMRGLEKIRAEFSLSALTYNLRRVLNLMSVPELLATLRQFRMANP